MTLFSEKIEQNLLPTGGETGALEMLRCARCGRDLVAEVVLAGDAACPYCGNLFRQPAYRRIEAIVDSGSFIEIELETEAGDPLSFPGYRTKLEKERAKSKMQEGVVICALMRSRPNILSVIGCSTWMRAFISIKKNRPSFVSKNSTVPAF